MDWYPDHLERRIRDGLCDANWYGEHDPGNRPLDMLSHHQRFRSQSPIIVSTSRAHALHVDETDLCDSIPSSRLQTRTPFYLAFARFAPPAATRAWEGAYICPVAVSGCQTELSVAFASRCKGFKANNASYLEQSGLVVRLNVREDISINEALETATTASPGVEQDFDHRTTRQLVGLLLATRLSEHIVEIHAGDSALQTTRLTPLFPEVHIGPSDVDYAMERRTAKSPFIPPHLRHQHVVTHERGLMRLAGKKIEWKLPSTRAVKKTSFAP